MIRLVAFDGDNTLWDFDRAMRAALQSTLEELWIARPGPATAALTVGRMVAIRNRVASELEGRVVDLAVVRHAAFERTLEEVGVEDAALAARLNAMFFAVKARRLAPFDDAVPALERLSTVYRTALLTNGNTEPADMGLDEWLDPIVHSGRVGVSKPDPAVFEVLLERTGIDAADAVYVGDSLVDDVAGARAAGMRAVWVNRSGAANPTAIVPDAEVRSLLELAEVLDGWT